LKLGAEQSEQEVLAGITDDVWRIIRQTVIEVHGGEIAVREIVDLLE
jgi:3-deoxy-D-manno-octulosonate 8-phosphate phosphatase KdsC-like HAD superfamily phosphatase